MTAVHTIQSAPPSPIRWSKSLYHQMADFGWFRDKRVQLIEGEIIEMAPMGTPHWVVVNNTNRALIPLFPFDQFTVAIQCPIDLGPISEPEPDVAVIIGIPSHYASGLPTPDAILLVVEVSDSSLAFDRDRKSKLYAAAGIVEYWVIDLAGRAVEVYREPISAEGRYGNVAVYAADDAITPLASVGASVRVSELIV